VSETRGSETRGSETRGSETRGSETRGSETRVGETRVGDGGEERGLVRVTARGSCVTLIEVRPLFVVGPAQLFFLNLPGAEET
jgi:hypothetical protein